MGMFSFHRGTGHSETSPLARRIAQPGERMKVIKTNFYFDKGSSACGYAHIILHKELIIIRFDSEVICMCFAEQVFFARLGARSVSPQRRAYARGAARRRVQWT